MQLTALRLRCDHAEGDVTRLQQEVAALTATNRELRREKKEFEEQVQRASTQLNTTMAEMRDAQVRLVKLTVSMFRAKLSASVTPTNEHSEKPR